MVDPLRVWKAKTAKQIVYVQKCQPRVNEFQQPMVFPTTKKELIDFLSTKRTALISLQTTIQRKLKLLTDYTDEGDNLVQGMEEPAKPAAEAELAFYLKEIDTVTDSVDEWLTLIDLRLTEIQEQGRLSGLPDFAPAPATPPTATSSAPAPATSSPRQQQEPETVQRPPTTDRKLPPSPPRDSSRSDDRQQLIGADEREGSTDDQEDRSSEMSWGGAPRNRPKQQLPKFAGNVRKFASFWSGFACMVHNAEDLSDLDKFFYLRQALKDDALRLIEEIPVTGSNYAKAVKLLRDRYDLGANMTTVVLADIQKMPTASRTTKSIRDTLETLRQKIITLECHGEQFLDINVWRSIILSKFPANVCSHIIKEESRLPEDDYGNQLVFSVEDFIDKIAKFVQLQECIELNTQAHSETPPASQPASQRSSHRQEPKNSLNGKKPRKKLKCVCGADDHRPHECRKFTSSFARRQEVRRLGVCNKCFEQGHFSKDCSALGPCPKCKGDHHSSLCSDSEGNGSVRRSTATTPASAQSKPKNSPVGCTQEYVRQQEIKPNLCADSQQVLRSTDDQIILMHVTGHLFNEESQTFDTVNVFIDDGAAISLIRTSVTDSFRLTTKGPFPSKVSGVGGHVMDLEHHLARATLRSKAFGEPDRILELKTIPEICQPLHTAQLSPEDWEKIKSLGVCLNRSDSPRATVDILIGQDFRQYFVYEEEPRIRLPSGLLLTKTVFGYAVTGRSSSQEELRPPSKLRRPARATASHGAAPLVGVYSPAEESALVVTASLPDPVRLDLQKDLSDLYSLENLGIRTDKDSNEMKVIDYMDEYRKTIKFKDGEAEAGFPFLDSVDQLKDNFNVAIKQLQHQLRDLQRKPEHLNLYEETFNDYLRQNFIEEVQLESATDNPLFYLPHHPVICPEKSTAFRVVFNASSKAKGEISLNDVIFPGYTLNALIYDVLLKFRSYDFAMVADIQKAFLQIRLPEAHRDVTRFLWIKDKHQPATGSNLKVFRFCRVPFGINASPAILNQVILKHLELIKGATSKEIAHTIYVDNVLLGGTSPSELLEKYKESKDIFSQIGMRLRDYLSSSPTANGAIEEMDRAKTTSVKVLGIHWDAVEDSLSLSLAKKEPVKKVTTRSVLSQVNGACYDPLGLMSPFLLRAKVFLQSLHKKKRGWDDTLTEEEQAEWTSILNELIGAEVTLPRRVTQLTDVTSRKLMVFSDSSQKAYGCAAYVVTTTTSGQSYSRLLTAKMKVTPIKELTIPRLELTGIFTAANLALTVLQESGLEFDEVRFFSDSTIALSWVKTKRLLPPFVKELANKIQKTFDKVRELVPMDIHHVPTSENVADIATRGLSKETSANHVWWTGPLWITQDPTQWPTSEITADAIHVFPVPVGVTATEGKRTFDVEGGVWPVTRVSSYVKLQRVVAYCLRFIKHISKGRQRLTVCAEDHKDLNVSGKEMIIAERHLLRQEQNKTDLAALQKECNQLNLQFDKDGLLRKYSRLNKSSMTFDQANPLFVPSKSRLSSLIIRHLHNSHFHRKGQHLMSLVQEKFWIPKLRTACDKIGKGCVPCSVYGRPYKYPLLPDLPPERVQRAQPFAYTGTDLFGPILVKTAGSSEEKRWVALFTCFVTRMVHLEIVKDQSARAYLLALRRFIGRRGVPLRLWSDNGTNFTLSWKLIQASQENSEPAAQELHAFVAAHHIEWTFIPPGAPWMGGTWERMVGLVKKPLLMAIGRRRIEEDLLHTLLCGVEATVNSRPLSSSPSDAEDILRPIDFCQPKLRLCSLPTVPVEEDDPDYLPTPLALSHVQAKKAIADIEAGLDRFWKKFHTDYLLSLKGIFNKKHMDYAAAARTPAVGDIVLLDEDVHAPRHTWPRGRIEALTPSADGNVRSVSVKISNGHVLHRPVNKLIPLEVSPSEPPEQADTVEPAAEPAPDNTEHRPVRQQPPRKAKRRVNYIENGEIVRGRPISFAALLPLLLVSSLLPMASAGTPQGVLTCIRGGIELNFDRSSLALPITSEICVNSRECTTLQSTTIKQQFFLSPRLAVADYIVQWRTIQGEHQMLETTTCPGTPDCMLIDCWICPELLGNPHCWPQAALFATIFWIYMALCTFYFAWKCCCRRRVRIFCHRKLTDSGKCLITTARRRCRQRKSSSSDDEDEEIPLVRVENNANNHGGYRGSRFVTIMSLALAASTLPPGETCQRVSVIESSHLECSGSNETCFRSHTVTTSMSHLRHELCIRTSQEGAIVQELKINLENIYLRCKPVVLFYTRNVLLKTVNVKRCAFAGSCTQSFCNSVSARTAVPELNEFMDFPGYTRCFASCGGQGCGCLLDFPGCLYSRTVAEVLDDYVYEVVKCPSWNVQAQLTLEELFSNGTRQRQLLGIRQQTTLNVGSTNVTVDFVASPPLPILSSVFIRRLPLNESKSPSTMGLIVPLQTDIALQCSSAEEAKEPKKCFLANTCLCSPSSTESHCNCKTFNITRGLQSLNYRIPVTTPDVAISMENGIISAASHNSVAEISISTSVPYQKIIVPTDRCTVTAKPVEGCYNCVRGASTEVICTAKSSQIATLHCEFNDFAVSCNSTGHQNVLRVFSAQPNFMDTCSVSCSTSNVSLSGVLTYSSLWNDNINHEERANFVSFVHLPDFSRILDVSKLWWKTSLACLLLLVVAVLIGSFVVPILLQKCAVDLLFKTKRQ